MNESLSIRPATPDDCRLYWEWANEAAVRAASFTSDPIPWDTHVAWFEKRLNAPDCRLYVIVDETEDPVAQVRFELDGPDAVVSISVAPQHRAKGLGLPALHLAAQRLFSETGAQRIIAFIRPSNEASLRLFRKAGYRNQQEATLNAQPAIRLELPRNPA